RSFAPRQTLDDQPHRVPELFDGNKIRPADAEVRGGQRAAGQPGSGQPFGEVLRRVQRLVALILAGSAAGQKLKAEVPGVEIELSAPWCGDHSSLRAHVTSIVGVKSG